jgi:hypothetical protein
MSSHLTADRILEVTITRKSVFVHIIHCYGIVYYTRDANMHLLQRPLHYSCSRKNLVHQTSLAITIGILLWVELVHKTWLLVGRGRVVVT